MDKLNELFDLQSELNKRIGVDTDNMNDEDKVKWVLNYTVPWKWWAKYQEFDQQNAKVEVVDLLHFTISLAQVLGMTPEDVHAAYTKKNQVNHDRQASGYSDKNEDDSRHI
jgi:dimeric dUTPase (all-alpha-NTP-PPase superfamily)